MFVLPTILKMAPPPHARRFQAFLGIRVVGWGVYNVRMDDEHTNHDAEREPEAPVAEAPAQVPPAAADVSMPLPSAGKEAWRDGSSGCGPRAKIYLIAVAIAGLIAILLVGLSVLRRGVWVTMDQGRQAVVQSLPFDLPPAERRRVIQNLDRFRAVLEASDDPYPTMGEFMTRVRAVLKDSRLTVDEVGGLNVYIERVIEESGIPPLQLGKRIGNEELGIRNAAHPSDGLKPAAGPVRNSKLKTQNSNLA